MKRCRTRTIRNTKTVTSGHLPLVTVFVFRIVLVRHLFTEEHPPESLDIHKLRCLVVDLRFLLQAALEAAERYGWTKIPCLDQEGRLRRIDEIHQDIWQAVRPLLETKER